MEEEAKTAEAGRVANGNGYKNGNGNAWASGLVNIASSGVLLAVFVIWWQTADPSKRIDKISDDQRLYLTKAEHVEFSTRMENSIKQLLEKNDTLVTKEAFKAWQVERDHLIGTIEKRLEDFRNYTVNFYEKFEALPNTYTTRNETLKDLKIYDITQNRIDRVYGLIDDLSKRISRINETIVAKNQSRLPIK